VPENLEVEYKVEFLDLHGVDIWLKFLGNYNREESEVNKNEQ